MGTWGSTSKSVNVSQGAGLLGLLLPTHHLHAGELPAAQLVYPSLAATSVFPGHNSEEIRALTPSRISFWL